MSGGKQTNDSPYASGEEKAQDRNRHENYGYDLYPEHVSGNNPSNWWKGVKEGRGAGDTIKCVGNVYWCYKTSELNFILIILLCKET